ncbi:hypothetical protein BLNAU_6911 [Blattamonas nauphoetae]|uniref:Uncharacterized protein n=1 Tax=Blattamonas nauphoetae TaxID=2049346 RepID=A0ABQ9Y383_9EUKA|nr:hypothetical protein BLNAU_6911 [Blattamonas nauphoetae]
MPSTFRKYDGIGTKRDFCSHGQKKSSSKVVESASRVVGHLCRVSMSGGDVEGVLNSGVVEGLCKQTTMVVSSPDGIGSGNGLEVLRSLDSLCMGLNSFRIEGELR